MIHFKLITIITLMLCTACSSTTCFNYAKVGVGYKFHETALYSSSTREKFNDPISGRVELGTQCESISYGVSHHSQPLTGYPFNKDFEYTKTEVFIDYMYKF